MPISLQQINSEKIHAVHSIGLAEGYTLIPMTIYIEKCLRGDTVKLVKFSLLAYFTACLKDFCVNALNSFLLPTTLTLLLSSLPYRNKNRQDLGRDKSVKFQQVFIGKTAKKSIPKNKKKYIRTSSLRATQ